MMSGWCVHTSTEDDRDLIMQTIGGTIPTAVRIAQVP